MAQQDDKSQEQPKPQCLIPGCTGESKTRGLCQRCYAAGNSQVKKGTVTWEKLVELGLAQPSNRETSTRNPFTVALARALQAQQPEGP